MRIAAISLMALALAACSTASKQGAQTHSAQPQVQPPPPAIVEKPADNPNLVKKESCESGKDKRMLEVVKKTTGCELSYTKFGKASVVSTSKHGLKHCEDSMDKIVKKLEQDKFKCDL